MTALVARSPLQSLGMNRAQAANKSLRRSARAAFDDEDGDAPPAKKSKAEGGGGAVGKAGATTQQSGMTGGAKQVNGRLNGAAGKRAKKDYDEDDNGFTFSRTRSKRTKAKATPEPEPVTSQVVEPAQPPQESEPTAVLPKRKPRKTLPATPEREEADKVVRVRRSKRLSGENEQTTKASNDPFARAPSAKPEEHRSNGLRTPAPTEDEVRQEQSPAADKAPASQKLHVEKKRRPTTIPLPFADTPVIRRNKEMRKISADQHRRSSSGMRGRRASSLIETGTSNAVPHTEVETAELYKHISQDLTEPRRMRQLLVWCGHRALPQKPSGGLDAAESQARHAARVIQDELLTEFGNRSDLSNWFDRQDTTPAVTIKKPNPRNIQNAAKLQELETELARLQAEKRSWDELLASTSTPSQSASKEAIVPLTLDPSNVDASLLDDSQVSILQTLLSSASQPQDAYPDPHQQSRSQSEARGRVAETARQRISTATESLEFKLDQFADSLHRLEQYRLCADRVADGILAKSAKDLEDRDRERKARTGANVDSIDVLRALSRVASGSGDGGERVHR